ncbi:MAG: cupin domain-containing protein [Chlamydiales bacterium]|nr:cupin domain-containing protein [Chlamydiales bacterium]
MKDIDYLVQKFGLKKLWTADFIGLFYSSSVHLPKDVLPAAFKEERLLFDWAYYLIPEGCICPFHLMYAEESWQYCSGGPLELWVIEGKNELKKIIIGPDFKKEESFIHIVEAGKWFAATPCQGSGYTLITHCVSPAFNNRDWVKGFYRDIISVIPDFQEITAKFSWPE